MHRQVPDRCPTLRLLSGFWLLFLNSSNSFYRTHRIGLPIRCALDFLVLIDFHVLIECDTSTALTEPSLDGRRCLKVLIKANRVR